ncbi:MAG: hypothetical protein A3K19_33575 [Lentisphaerae bacterium RIFOXYB12_FULL_65_16]|nr:MAG: hypothetical protein A3K19_00170 [Lentisphaerae bacterium RIFOXYB12_FULL_65_16]OGV95268.1 MAG: hypothetical protein A3K19_33575 [Lentisphaerae bacterium RIFOXYB12_FULL_65_16]
MLSAARVAIAADSVDELATTLRDPAPAAVKRAEKALRRLADGKGRDAAGAARVLAEFLREKGRPEEGAQLLERYAAFESANVRGERLPLFLESARCQAAANQVRLAAKMLDFAAKDATGIPAALVLEARGDLEAMASRHEPAVKQFTAARDAAAKASREWAVQRERIAVKRDAAQDALDAGRYGEGFVAYRRARRCHLAGAWAGAVVLYDQVGTGFLGTVYSEAAALYREQCRLRLGQFDAAAKALEAFIAADPLGLYRPEARLSLAAAWLEEKQDLDRATTELDRALDCIVAVRKHDREVQLYLVPAVAADVTRPPDQPSHIEQLGLVPERILPDHVINRTTAPWYLRGLERDAHRYRGFAHFARGDTAAAGTEFDAAAALDVEELELARITHTTFARRLKIACRAGFFLCMPDEVATFRGRERILLQLADFYGLWERWEEAERLYRRLLDAPSCSREQRACLLVALAEVALHRDGNRDRVSPLLRESLKTSAQAPCAPRALLALGCDEAIPLKDRTACLEKACKGYPQSDYGQKAMFHLGFILSAQPETQGQATKVLTDFARRFPENRFVPLANDLVQKIRTGEINQNQPPAEPR